MNEETCSLQWSFADIGGDEVFRKPRKPSRGKEIWPLKSSVRLELRAFKQTLIRQGRVQPDSANTYMKALASSVKQAQRHLGRFVDSIWEIYEVDTIAAIAKDDEPFDSLVGDQIAKGTLRQRRVVMRSFIRNMTPLRAPSELEDHFSAESA